MNSRRWFEQRVEANGPKGSNSCFSAQARQFCARARNVCARLQALCSSTKFLCSGNDLVCALALTKSCPSMKVRARARTKSC